MKDRLRYPRRVQNSAIVLLSAFVFVASLFSGRAQDILLADFEETNYAWLPGGAWTSTGTAFGSGPAQGTLVGQNPVGGFLGGGLVDSYRDSDTSTGTLTSPPFTIQRNHLKFLIGGGNWRGQTCVNLLVNGQVVRSAVGMGDREQLDWLQWNVSAFSNQTAQIQIVDSATGMWGHVNVDQIIETDASLSSVIIPNLNYLNFPIRSGAPKHLVELLQDGLVVREMNVELADSATNFYAFMDLTPFQGKELTVRLDSQLATSNQLAAYFIQSSNILATTPIYEEALRPLYHYSARRGWINDANGMVCYAGEYHFSYQHNPFGTLWDNMNWGHAVSTDLVHWTELPEALYPDFLGTEFSGSAVVDFNNSAGFGTNALVDIYCSAGGQNRMSAGRPSTQCLAYSLDQGRTWTKYTNNPVLNNLADGNRDPKVIWYAPGNKWVMALYLINNDFAFFSSTDLKHWTQTSTFTFPGAFECPELFSLPLDGNTDNARWIFYTNLGHYYVGNFDGNAFTPQYGPFTLPGARNFWAAQTFNNIPSSDGRRILMSNGSQSFSGVPFNQLVTFPIELTLATSGGTPVLYANPVREIALLRATTNTIPPQPMTNCVNIMQGMTGEACELDTVFQPGSASQITFSLRGASIVYNNSTHQLAASGATQPLVPTNGTIHLRMLVDRGIIELFGNDGLLYMPLNVVPASGPQPLSMVAAGNGAQLISLNLHDLNPAWNYPVSGSGPTIITQPTAATSSLGAQALFGVTAIGTGPLHYQWRSNGQPIVGATNGSLSLFPVSGSNATYDVIVSNSGGSVTSSVVPLTIHPAYSVASWSMEAQIQAPNASGIPTYNGVVDGATNAGQGIFSNGSLPAEVDDLITFNGLSNQPVTLSTNVAPASMFANGRSGGGFSYNAEAISNVDGVLFFPQDQYGDEMDFTGPFSIELFFKSDGDKSNAGAMQLIAQGTDVGQNFRYGVAMNESASGGVRFTVANSSLGQSNVVDMTGANFADGQWHYLLAVCDTLGGPGGQLRLAIVNRDGTEFHSTNNLPPGFLPLPAEDDGNLFIGRNSYALNQTPRTFLGLVDEVQIYSGVIPDGQRIGIVPSIDGASDLLLSDFEETNYAWLPGGSWSITGDAFGSGPSLGRLANQNPVDGYFGNGLVNSFNGGDTSTGTLTSPSFIIQRKYIKFLIGAGNQRGLTCMNLLVNGQVVRSAVGMGDREHLDWLQWNVGDLTNQTAQIQVVDNFSGGWGHINADQIIQTDKPLGSTILATQRYLNFPVSYSGTNHLVELIRDGLVEHEFNIALVTNGTPDYCAFLDLSNYAAKEFVVRVDSQLADSNQIASLTQSNSIIAATPIYQETLRPVYHFSARRGFINDPNGMVYLNGEYHLAFQHNPYGLVVGNQHWGNAVSSDLVHWQELPEAIYPDWRGQAWSGSSVVDPGNTAGYGSNAIVSFYTAAGGHGNNPRMSSGQLFTQCQAYSTDLDRTFIKSTNNPVLPNVLGDNRDPRVTWYAPGNKWVMVLWLTNNDFGFFSSTDTRHWSQTSTFTFPNVIEVPELFQLPLDGNTNNPKWIFYAGAGHYYVGNFDGSSFSPQYGPFSIRGGNSFAAGQTFYNVPASDGRKILIANGTQDYPNMPFQCAMDFPVELTLVTASGIPAIYVNPARELALLRNSTNVWGAQTLSSGSNVLAGLTAEAFELDSQFQPGSASSITFNLRGTPVVYSNSNHQVTCSSISQSLAPINGMVHLHILVDRGILEIFGNDGVVYMPMTVPAVAGALPISLLANGNGAQLVSMKLYNLGSAWSQASLPPAPSIISQPSAYSTVGGGPAFFNVTATGLGSLSYQWLKNGQAITGATNSSLSLFPVSGSNSTISVVVSNSGGSITSTAVILNIQPPYPVSLWRMEAQIQAPNSSGIPSFNGVADSDTASGQGAYATGTLSASIDDLIAFNGLPGNPISLSTNVPPQGMFVNGHGGGNFSYNAEAITNVDGALFFPQDQYGDEMDFTGPFSIEFFFKSDGNRSGAGLMQLISQGTDTGKVFRYGVSLNESSPGGLRFKLANSILAQTNVVDLTAANYADGAWHYLLAICDTLAGANGQIRLMIVNQDGFQAAATNTLPPGFLPLPATNNGNMFIGRNTYPANANPSTFLGYIDEVQISSGVIPDNFRIGRLPSNDNHPIITIQERVANGLAFSWTGAAANSFSVQWVARLGDVWQDVATVTSSAGVSIYQETNLARLANSMGYYRVASH